MRKRSANYREAIDALTPGVPIAGPDVSGSGVFPEWGEEEALSQKPALLTGHHYPLGCAQTPAPSIETLLSAETREREAQSLTTYMSVANAYRIPFRLDEANSVSCGGVAGISDTFASTLWATGYITQAMAAGAAGINLQGNPTNCTGYTPLCAPDPAALASGSLRAQPDWYALLLTSSLAGDRPLATTISAEPQPNLVAASFAGPGHSLKVLLVDDEEPGASPLALLLNVGAGLGVGQVLRLTAARTERHRRRAARRPCRRGQRLLEHVHAGLKAPRPARAPRARAPARQRRARHREPTGDVSRRHRRASGDSRLSAAIDTGHRCRYGLWPRCAGASTGFSCP